jgi:hypothetical protein
MAMSPRLLRPVASGFNPASISGLAAWYDGAASSTITLNGSTVSQWADRSGNGRNLVQATAALQPNYNATGLNGRGTLSTTGTQWMQASAFPTNAAGTYTAMTVMRFKSLTGQPYAFQRGTVNDAHSMLISSANTWAARRSNGNQGTLSQLVSLSEWYLATLVFRTDLSRIIIGTTSGTDNTSNVIAPTGNKVLTLFALDANTRGGQPDFAEFLYWDAELTAVQQLFVRKYLTAKWSLTL